MFGRLIRGIKIPVEFALDRLRATAGQVQRIVNDVGRSVGQGASQINQKLRAAWDLDIGRIRAGWVAAAAAVKKALGGLVGGVVSGIRQFAELESAMMNVMVAANAAGESMTAARDAAVQLSQDGFLTAAQAAQALSNFLRTGFSLEESVTLVRFAKDMAAFGNSVGDASQAVVDFSRGLRMGSIAVMENAGWTTRLSAILGDNIDLTRNAEQRTKFLAAAYEEWNRVQGDAARYMDTVSGRLAQQAAALDEAKLQVGAAFAPLVESLVPAIVWASKAFGGFVRFVDTGSAIIAGKILSIGPTVKAASAAILEGLTWLVREAAGVGRQLVELGTRVPVLGNLLGVVRVGSLFESVERWADNAKRRAREWGDEVRAELRAIRQATTETAAEVYRKYENLASAVAPPAGKTPTPRTSSTGGGSDGEKDRERTEADITRRLIARAEALERMIRRTAGAERAAFQRQFDAALAEIERISREGVVGEEGGRDAALTWLEQRAAGIIQAAIDEATLLRDLIRFAGEAEREALRARYEEALEKLRRLLADPSVSEQQRVRIGQALEQQADAIVNAAIDEVNRLRDLIRFAGEAEREALRARYDEALKELRRLLADRSVSEQHRVRIGQTLEQHEGQSERLREAIQRANLLLTELEYATEEARGAIREQLEGAIGAVQRFTGSEDLEVRASALEAVARLREELQVLELTQLPATERAWREFLQEIERTHSVLEVLKGSFQDLFDGVTEGIINAFDAWGAAFDQAEDAGKGFFAAMEEGARSAADTFASNMLGALAEVARHWSRYAFARATMSLASLDFRGAALYTAAGVALAALAGAIGHSGARAGGGLRNEINEDFKRADEHKGGQIVIVLPDGLIDPTDPDWQRLVADTIQEAGANNIRVTVRNSGQP